MKPLILLLLITALASSAEQYVYVRDGAIITPPRALPSIGVNRTTGQAVLGLHGATDAIKASCGWYRVTAAAQATAVPPNHVITATTYQINAHTVTPIHTYAERRELTLQDRVTALFSARSDDAQIKEVLDAVAAAVTNKLATPPPAVTGGTTPITKGEPKK